MLVDAKTSVENQRRFIERVTATEVVYYLTSEHGAANSTSNENEEITVLPFWSDASYAKRVLGQVTPTERFQPVSARPGRP